MTEDDAETNYRHATQRWRVIRARKPGRRPRSMIWKDEKKEADRLYNYYKWQIRWHRKLKFLSKERI